MKNRFNFTAHHSLNFWVLIIQGCFCCILPDHLNAQCKDNQNNVEFSYYNIMLVMDQSYIDAHGGNVVDSRSAAIGVADSAINALNNPVKPFVFKYKLHFKRIFFPETLAVPIESDPEQHATAVNMFFRNESMFKNFIALTNQFAK